MGRSRMRLVGMVAIPLLFAATACPSGDFPGAHWPTMTPAEAGLDADVLDRLRDYMQGRGCIVRHGHLVYTWGDYTQPGDVASAAKPWYSFFLFKAVEEGRLASLDEQVSGYAPCLDTLNEELGFKDRDILFRHLATQTSCYGVREAPGTAFDYNDWQMALFVDTLFLGVYGATYATLDDTVLHPLLTDLLQCEDDPTFMAFGEGNRSGRVAVSPRDFCRFGYLFLQGGRWKRTSILSAENVRRCTTEPLPAALPRTQAEPAAMCPDQWTLGSQAVPDDQCDHVGSYSWLWWINGVDRDGRRYWPDAPTDVFAALGHRNGMRGMAVIPSLDIVISWNDTALGDMPEKPHPLNTAFALLRKSASSPLPGQIVVDPRHPVWLARNEDRDRDGALDPFFLCGPGDPEGFLYRGARRPDGTRDGDQEDIIRKMKGTGANCLYIAAIRSHGGDGDEMQNPFVDGDPGKGLDDDILDQWETWFKKLDDNGIVVFFFLYDDSARIWRDGETAGPDEAAFIERIVHRFDHHRYWIWCVAEECGEAFSAEEVRNIATSIRNADRHRHVIAVHKNESLTFDEFADCPDIDVFAAQWNVGSASALHDGMTEAWRNANGRYNVTMAEANAFGFGNEALTKCWACAMAGSYVMALDWSFDRPDAPSTDDLKMCGHLVRFFESARFNEMTPHDELGGGGAQYVLAAPSASYIAYTSDPNGPVTLKEMEAGAYISTWFDPATGKSVTQDCVRIEPGERRWERPAGFDGPAALYVRRDASAAR
ncbi:MAG: hypothetical protein QG656_451 [Candidatus Hydrogenedentes bacterium]|nr:hypothetical protein [Candidatus Hydrogenedentota bacterium]